MDELGLVVSLGVTVVAAVIGGAVAHRLGQPVILGYLVGGMALGPYTPGPVVDTHTVEILAELGVAFLMFALGAELSLPEIRRVGAVAALGGLGQMAATMALVTLAAPLFGLGLYGGVFLGALLALSSTVVALKVLGSRGEQGSLHAKVAVGFLVMQDLALVPLIVILPALAGPSETLALDLGLAAITTTAMLAAALILGTRAVPWLLARVAASGSRELFLLSVVGIALGTALMAHAVGLSLALGAFLGGLIVSESDLSHQAVADILPLRDLFATLFFTSVGMLIDPMFLVENAAPLVLVVVLVVVGKGAITALMPLLFGFPARTALLVGLTLAQVGEFSFVLARQGVELGAIPERLYSLTLAAALVTILLSPFLLRLGLPLSTLLAQLPLVGGRLTEPAEAQLGDGPELRRHTVICGFGRVGGELAEALSRRGFQYLVIEQDPRRVERLKQRGIPVIYGDASNPAVLEHAHLQHARLLAATMPDARAVELTVRHARSVNPRLDIVARAQSGDDLPRLRAAGADEVIHPQFEAGLEIVRHSLRRYGVSAQEVELLVSGRRIAHYLPTAEAR
jgi:monovalent cation:H+ antiporter-2, CPA2 family